VADIEGWPRTGEVPASRLAHVWISPEQARWAREDRTLVAELPDGAVVVEWAFKGVDFLVREVLREAGDAAVLEPADAREAVRAAAERMLAAQVTPAGGG
jgi:predicted DNA-binding transcriptional regulator YafY